jgi:hypothetical protein
MMRDWGARLRKRFGHSMRCDGHLYAATVAETNGVLLLALRRLIQAQSLLTSIPPRF